MWIIALRSPSLAMYLGEGGWKTRIGEATHFVLIEDAVDAFKDFYSDLPIDRRQLLQIEEV